LTEKDLDAIAGAWLESDKTAMVGFNRRFAPATTALKAVLDSRVSPLQIVIRVFAGQLPADHWSLQPEQGGRLLGEACHFVDLACFLVGSAPVEVAAQAPGGSDPVR